jgi:hypothetical protein
MSKGTCETCRVVYDGTYVKRCDYCVHWKPLSSARVMGWCEIERPMPDHVPPMMIILGRLSDDQVTAYNQVCGEHQPKGDVG